MYHLNRLREDHRSLRLTLGELTATLKRGFDAYREALRLCSTLSVGLRDHIRFEGRLVVSCSRGAGHADIQQMVRLAAHHEVDREYLRLLTRQLLKGSPPSPAGLAATVFGLLSNFDRHAREQEHTLLPIIERSSRLQPRSAPVPFAHRAAAMAPEMVPSVTREPVLHALLRREEATSSVGSGSLSSM